ncbi:hypothetical protein C8J38_10790 [Rhizobium sp. PP-WC-2G-219]|nr:hypothetical protein C8J38_10790 [Rhizobium sp. PP-WC-2G-219]
MIWNWPSGLSRPCLPGNRRNETHPRHLIEWPLGRHVATAGHDVTGFDMVAVPEDAGWADITGEATEIALVAQLTKAKDALVPSRPFPARRSGPPPMSSASTWPPCKRRWRPHGYATCRVSSMPPPSARLAIPSSRRRSCCPICRSMKANRSARRTCWVGDDPGSEWVKVWLATGLTDMRKGRPGLSLMVQRHRSAIRSAGGRSTWPSAAIPPR